MTRLANCLPNGRKDHVFLFERFFYFLEDRQEHGLLVMDELEKEEDRRFVRRLEAYFRRTQTGRYRTAWIVPTPLFVSSDMTYSVQAAEEFGPWLNRLQYRGQGQRDGSIFDTFGVVYVPDPYTAR